MDHDSRCIYTVAASRSRAAGGIDRTAFDGEIPVNVNAVAVIFCRITCGNAEYTVTRDGKIAVNENAAAVVTIVVLLGYGACALKDEVKRNVGFNACVGRLCHRQIFDGEGGNAAHSFELGVIILGGTGQIARGIAVFIVNRRTAVAQICTADDDVTTHGKRRYRHQRQHHRYCYEHSNSRLGLPSYEIPGLLCTVCDPIAKTDRVKHDLFPYFHNSFLQTLFSMIEQTVLQTYPSI